MSLDNVQLKIEFDVPQIQKDLRESMSALVSQNLARQVRAAFDSRSNWGSKDGKGTVIINNAIDEYVASDEFAQAVQKAIRDHADEAARLAVKARMNSRSRKVLFDDESEQLARVQSGYESDING